jgi:hypothetical protein
MGDSAAKNRAVALVGSHVRETARPDSGYGRPDPRQRDGSLAFSQIGSATARGGSRKLAGRRGAVKFGIGRQYHLDGSKTGQQPRGMGQRVHHTLSLDESDP